MEQPQAVPPMQVQLRPTELLASDSGRNLEASVPAPTPLQPENSVRRITVAGLGADRPEQANALGEPTGVLLPPTSPLPPSPFTSSTYLPGFPAEVTAEIDRCFEHLLATVHANRPGDDLGIIRSAWQFCMSQHEGQKRASGEPYIIHPLDVGQILAEMKMDSTAIAAGLLHDAVEDTDVSSQEISRRFGAQVAHIVEGVTKLDRIKFANKEDHQAENIRKMLLAMVTDIRVVLIKLADRLHNMRTLGHLRPDKQQRIARETLEIYAPLAHRLGMGKLRGEFEDLSFQYVDPARYLQLAQQVEALRIQGGERFIEEIVAQLETELVRHGVPGTVEYRIKRLYSISMKVNAHVTSGGTDDLSQVHDLYAIRIVTQTQADCYHLLGIVQNQWRPVPGRIKDFIAMPRPNGYQSLHTTLVAGGGTQFEVQIRTEEMHRIAEDGIAAHWKYKANESVNAKDEQRLAWVRQLMEWQREMTDPNEFMSTLKIDLYPEEVYTFTPKGKVVVLPKDASPIDFAYTIHTEVGHTTVGAKVNGRIVPLRHRLRNGDIVEITTQTGHTPSRDWLTFTKSSRARNKIKHWLNEHQRERAMEIGRKLLEREARKFKVSLTKLTDTDYERVANVYGLGNQGDLLSSIGFGKYSARQALNKLVPGSTSTANAADAAEAQQAAANPTPPGSLANVPASELSKMSDAVKRVYFGKGSDSLQVEGQGDLLVYRARCCNPIRGEEIVGYVTRGKGVAVHARSCPNVQNLLYESDRRINVEWAPLPEDLRKMGLGPDGKPLNGPDGKPLMGTDGKPVGGSTGSAPKPTRYPVRLIVLCDDRSGMLKELTAIISDDDTNIRSVDSRANEDGTTATVDFVVETLDLRHLNKLTVDMSRVPGVREVQRVSKI
ncbi:MAG: RelA/SpoT family protein [Janthinobacterium lividum]